MLLALTSAVVYGVSDFLGGTVSRRATAVRALLLGLPAGLALIVAGAAFGGAPSADGLAWGFGAGVAGGAGMLAFYRALARGPMSVVAPVSALAAAVLPVAAGVLRGERLDAPVVVGVVLCLVAIGLVSMEKDDGARVAAARRPQDSGPLVAGLAGVCFGVFFILLKEAGGHGGLWPIAASRTANLAVAVLAAAYLVRRHGALPGPAVRGRPLIALAVASGVLDAAANTLYFVAARSGMLSLAAVLTSLYPAITVLMARFAYSERLRAVQRVGMALAAAGVALVTVG
ncbi:EamA family transporter [Actinomadura atramentaria]|uniref:EamA family transporter n=1 Tax=Actinomadura atramentaria TaxID=1990 RepID=UPI000526B6BD|nr:EamA family transporter [Actinomadura atramentaria]